MTFNREDIRHLGDLAKMKLSESEIDHFRTEINAIVRFVHALDEVDVANVVPLYQLNGAHDRMQADVPHISIDAPAIRAAFPESAPDGSLSVHAVFVDKKETL